MSEPTVPDASFPPAEHTDTSSLSNVSQPSQLETAPPLILPPSNTVFLDRTEGISGTGKGESDMSDMAVHGADTSIVTGENELASTTMAEQTLVDGINSTDGGEAGRTHSRGPSSSTVLSLKGRGGQMHNRDDSRTSFNHPATWDPLHANDSVDNDKTQLHDDTVVMEEDDMIDANGQVLYPDESDNKPTALPSRRTSHLRLDLKPPSPMPWEQIEPPADNNDKSVTGHYSVASSRKFRTLQSAGGPRPLIPKSSYYFGPPPPDSAYGTQPIGQIGVHHPREVLRVERDYSGGEVIQFAPIYPLELENRITPTHFLESINAINELLISAHSLRHSVFDNTLAVFSLQISRLFVKSHFEKEMDRLHSLINDLNSGLFNPVGLNILWPRNVAFLYLEIEYY